MLCLHPGTGQTLLFAPADGHGVKKSRLTRDRDRDISEKIALGQAAVKPSGEGMYDQRLFNQDSGMQHMRDCRVLPEGGGGGEPLRSIREYVQLPVNFIGRACLTTVHPLGCPDGFLRGLQGRKRVAALLRLEICKRILPRSLGLHDPSTLVDEYWCQWHCSS